jgi:ATP-dependent Clp protease adaptor protein ClpS
MSQTVVLPEILDSSTQSGGWMVLIYNNDHNSMEEVVEILMKATQCDAEEASIEMWEAHHYGKASVHYAGRAECDRVAAIIATVGIQTEVCEEWPE